MPNFQPLIFFMDKTLGNQTGNMPAQNPLKKCYSDSAFIGTGEKGIKGLP
jgi:hypothetical protein